MRLALSKLRELPYFRLDDYILSAAPREPARKGQNGKVGPLYVSRPIAPRLPRAKAKRIQTYNPAGG